MLMVVGEKCFICIWGTLISDGQETLPIWQERGTKGRGIDHLGSYKIVPLLTYELDQNSFSPHLENQQNLEKPRFYKKSKRNPSSLLSKPLLLLQSHSCQGRKEDMGLQHLPLWGGIPLGSVRLPFYHQIVCQR